MSDLSLTGGDSTNAIRKRRRTGKYAYIIFVLYTLACIHIQLLNSKCIPVLLYGLEACLVLKSDLSSVDFVIVRFLMNMKLFNTTNMDIINNCRQYLDVELPSTLWSDRVRRFEKKFAECDKIFFCKISVSIR